MKTTTIDLTKGPVLKVITLFALPIMVSNIFQQLYNTADTMIVGHFLGEKALASVGATAAIFELIVGFALGVGNGMSIVIARHYGAKNETQVKKAVASTMVIGLGLSLLVMLIGSFGLKPLLVLLGTPSNIIAQSYSYISKIMIFVIVTFTYNLGAGLLRAIGYCFYYPISSGGGGSCLRYRYGTAGICHLLYHLHLQEMPYPRPRAQAFYQRYCPLP